jgi:hypothetical protein
MDINSLLVELVVYRVEVMGPDSSDVVKFEPC